MNALNNFFEVHVEELSSWTRRPYKNNFFEIVYIERGSGVQCVNNKKYQYHRGNIFLLPPLDCHSFRIYEPTKFYFIRFSDEYFHNHLQSVDYKAWFDKISYILANYNRIPGDIIASQTDRDYIISTIKNIYKEYTNADAFSEAINSGSVASILNILARSIENKYINKTSHSDTRFSTILRYINSNLLSQDKLKISSMADHFGISQGYFSKYFKKQSGVNLAEYIIKAKLRLAETYILHTDLSLKEIAYQLNFSDSSHLSNTFKKNYNITIKEFRQKGGSVHRHI